MIRVTDYHKIFENTVAVAGLSFQVRAGEVLGLVGPNGAGKTTTLRSLCGLIPPTRGDLEIDGLDVTEDPLAVKRRVAYVADDPRLFDDLTVDQHLDFIASVYQVVDPEPKIEELLTQFELIGKVDERANALSRGMRQKLAICCAYLFDPKVLLLDEPLTGLDPPGIRHLLDSIRHRAAGGTAVVISSHLLAMIETVCSHALLLEQGRSLFWGKLEDFKLRFESGGTSNSLEQAFFAATSNSPVSNPVGSETQC